MCHGINELIRLNEASIITRVTYDDFMALELYRTARINVTSAISMYGTQHQQPPAPAGGFSALRPRHQGAVESGTSGAVQIRIRRPRTRDRAPTRQARPFAGGPTADGRTLRSILTFACVLIRSIAERQKRARALTSKESWSV